MPIILCMKWVHSTAKVPALPGVTVMSTVWPLSRATRPLFDLGLVVRGDLRGGKNSGALKLWSLEPLLMKCS